MRYLSLVLFAVLCTAPLRAQTFEVGPYLGGANYIGDVGSTNYIDPNEVFYGVIFKWNRSKRHAFRFSLTQTELSADDANSSEARRRQRGLSFSNRLTEASLGLEYTFWEWDLFSNDPQYTPYLYTGFTGIYTNDLYLNQDGELKEEDDKFNVSIPMIIGFKARIAEHFVLAAEIGARMTFSDNLDGSSPKEFDGGENLPSFGNQNTNDWYMFTGLTLTYTFGRKPCYCNF